MTPEASRIIFGNIDEIAIFADRFAERLESALGNVLKHSGEDDRVGELFLEVVSHINVRDRPEATTLKFIALDPSYGAAV